MFSGDEVALPVIQNERYIRIGVYAGDLRTTTSAVIFCRRCITDGSGSPADPTPDVYAQLMALLNDRIGIWYPTVDDAGNMSWEKSDTEEAPAPTNIKGPIGETGAQGSQGEKGPKGDKGDTGAQGPKGDTGATGATGPQGPKGDKGDTGPQGPAGADGATGASGADGKSAYQYAVEGGYTGTEEEFTAKLAQEKFANPNALTFTGAVTGSYDGSEALTVEIPSGGGGGVDMGITGATVGQIAKIAAVDESGVPTAWSPVDMPSGGGDETPIDTISEGTLSEDVANIVIDGFSKRAIALVTVPYGSTANSGTIKISLKFGLDSGDVLTLTPNYNFVTNTAAVSWNKIVVFASVDNGIFDATIYRDGASISGDIYINNSIATNVWVAKSIYIGAKKITSVTIGLQADGVIGKNTVYKVVGA